MELNYYFLKKEKKSRILMAFPLWKQQDQLQLAIYFYLMTYWTKSLNKKKIVIDFY